MIIEPDSKLMDDSSDDAQREIDVTGLLKMQSIAGPPKLSKHQSLRNHNTFLRPDAYTVVQNGAAEELITVQKHILSHCATGVPLKPEQW